MLDFISNSKIYIIIMSIITLTSLIITFSKNIKETKGICKGVINSLTYKKRQEEKIDKLIKALEKNNEITDVVKQRVDNLSSNIDDLYKRMEDVEVLGLKQMVWNPNASLEERVEAGDKYVNVYHRNSTTKALYISLKKELQEKEDKIVKEQLKNQK